VRWLVTVLFACSSTSVAPTTPPGPGPVEPAAPVIECDVHPEPVHCEPGHPTRTALQPSPYPWCAREKPGSKHALGGTGRLFSAAETKVARAKDPAACCYLEWTWMACD
jgi:hypothetical protein